MSEAIPEIDFETGRQADLINLQAGRGFECLFEGFEDVGLTLPGTFPENPVFKVYSNTDKTSVLISATTGTGVEMPSAEAFTVNIPDERSVRKPGVYWYELTFLISGKTYIMFFGKAIFRP